MPQVRIIPALSECVKRLQVAAYARVSSDSVDQLNSFATQMEYYTQYIKSQSEWEFAGLYADEAVSGTTTGKREDFQRLLKDCRAGKIDRILVKSISRFARNTLDCIAAVRELKQLGVTVLFEKENLDTANLGSEMMLSVLGAAAQEESLSISKSIKWSIRKRMQAGEFLTCRAPYGYILQGRKLEIHPQEAEIVRSIYRRYLNGASMEKIVSELNEKYISKRAGTAPWCVYHIQYILTNEKYIGDSLVQKRYTPDILPFRLQKNTGELPQYYIENSHPAIISREDYQAVRKLIAQKTCPAISPAKSVLSQKMVCGICGSILKHKSVSDKWVCRKHDRKKELCPFMPVATAEIYQAFLHLFHTMYEHQDAIFFPLIRDLKILKNKKNDAQEMLYLNSQIAKLVQRQHALARLVTKGSIDTGLYIERVTIINRELSELQKKVKVQREEAQIPEFLKKTEKIFALLKEANPCLTFDPDMFQRLIEKIEISPEAFHFHLMNGLILKEAR